MRNSATCFPCSSQEKAADETLAHGWLYDCRRRARPRVNVVLRCSRCQKEMNSTGLRGLCPQCLFACTTAHQISPAEKLSDPVDETLAVEASVGPDNRFLLLDKLGEGGMGEVWLANDQALSQPGEPQFVALKFLSKSIRHNKQAIAALRAEVLRSQKLAHPHIVRIFDLHMTRKGTPFIKMEFVEGNSLARWLHDHPEHVMPWRSVVQIVHQLAGALQYAHQVVGIVHRDLKPANLLLGDGGVIKLSDFGIAQLIRSNRKHSSDTGLVGTLSYASPQQIAGADPDPADDIYALGATIYELLTGTPPFQGETPEELIQKINTRKPQPISQRLELLDRENPVPGKLVLLVQRCLEKNPVDRPKAAEIIRFLPPVEAEDPTETNSEVKFATDPAPERKLANWIWTFLFLLVVTGSLAWLFDVAGSRARVGSWLASVAASWRPADPPGQGDSIPTLPPPALESAPVDDLKQSGPPIFVPPSQLPGELLVEIESSDRFSDYDIELVDDAGRMVLQKPIRGSRTRSNTFTANLPPGNYSGQAAVRASLRPGLSNWVLKTPFEIQSGRRTTARFPFKRGRVFVETFPTNAELSWINDSKERGGRAELKDMITGNIQMIVYAKGFSTYTTNFFFDASAEWQTPLVIQLEKSAHPNWGEDWINSLGLEFKWVQAIKAWVCTTETRVRDYRLFARDSKLQPELAAGVFSLTTNGWEQKGDSWDAPGFAQSDDHPVVMINWQDATNFCYWLNSHEPVDNCLGSNQSYTLPSTNEWMAVAGKAEFPWGDSFPPTKDCNVAGIEIRKDPSWPREWPLLEGHEDGYLRTAPVKTTSASGGFCHLSGNAAEWCWEQVLAGGSWFDGESGHLDCLKRNAVRIEAPSRRDSRNGFRLIIKQNP